MIEREGGERWGNVHDPKLVEPETADTDPFVFVFLIVFVCWRNRNSRLEFPIRRESSKFLRLIGEKMSALFFDFSFRIPLGTEIPGRIPSEMLSAHDSLYSVLFRQHIIDPLGASIDQTMDDQRNFLSTFLGNTSKCV